MSNLAFEDNRRPAEEEPRAAAASGLNAADVRPVPRISVQAFCESPEVAAAIEAAAGDRRMARAHVKVHTGGIAAAAEFYQGAATPNLIIVESKLSRERLDNELNRLANVCDAGTKVVVIGHVNDVELYRDLTRRGVSEYLVVPVDLLRIIKTIGELYGERSAKPLGRTIAFVGGKGGAGSSMVAHNVAWATRPQFPERCRRRRSRPCLRNRRSRLQPGSDAGHRRGGPRSRPPRRRLPRPPARPLLGPPQPACRAGDA